MYFVTKHKRGTCSSGLSNESWSIMKNMATELGIILIGYFTLVPAIQVPQRSVFRPCPAPSPKHTASSLTFALRFVSEVLIDPDSSIYKIQETFESVGKDALVCYIRSAY